MRLDPRISETDLRRMLLRRAAETFGPARTKDLGDTLQRTASALALIAQQPLALTDAAPDRTGVVEGEQA